MESTGEGAVQDAFAQVPEEREFQTGALGNPAVLGALPFIARQPRLTPSRLSMNCFPPSPLVHFPLRCPDFSHSLCWPLCARGGRGYVVPPWDALLLVGPTSTYRNVFKICFRCCLFYETFSSPSVHKSFLPPHCRNMCARPHHHPSMVQNQGHTPCVTRAWLLELSRRQASSVSQNGGLWQQLNESPEAVAYTGA